MKVSATMLRRREQASARMRASRVPAVAGAQRVSLQQQARLDDVDLLAHDALICADIALRITDGGFNAQDGVWYVLEPQFQATSERLFGFTDVGSEREERDEAIALRDPTLARAVDAVEAVLWS